MNLDNLPIARPALRRDIAIMLLEYTISNDGSIEQISDYAEEMEIWNDRFIAQFRRRKYSPWTIVELEDFIFKDEFKDLTKLNIVNFYEEVKKHVKDKYRCNYLLRTLVEYSLHGLVLRYVTGKYTRIAQLLDFNLHKRSEAQQLQKLAKYLKDRKSLKQLGWAAFHEKMARKRGNIQL